MSDSLPRGWCWLPLEMFGSPEPNAITDGPFGSNLKTSDYVEGGEVRVIRLGNIGAGRFIDEDKSFVTAEKFTGLTKHEARPGDLVIAALAEPVGRCVEVPDGLGTAMVKADCVRVRVNSVFERRYLLHALNSPGGRARAEAAAHGLGRLRINLGDLRSLLVPAAPPNEQRRIVAKLESLQERSRRARDSLDAVPALLDKLRQSILAAAFRGDLTRDFREKHKDLEPASKLLQRIRTERRKKWEEAELAKLTAKGRPPTDDKWKSKYKEPDPVDPTGLPKLPDGWCWASVDEVTSAVRTACYGVVQPGDDCTDGVPLVRVCDLMGDGETILMHALRRIPVDVANEYDRSRIEGGELLVSVVGTIGRTAIAPVSLRGANIARAVARLVFEQMVKADWVMHWFNCSFMWHRLNLESREVARKTLNVAQLVEMPVPVAPTSEMMELCTLLRSMRTQISTIHSETAKLAEHATTLDRAILAKAFRGELVPQDPRDEPADVMLARTTASLTPAREKRGRLPGAKDAHPE